MSQNTRSSQLETRTARLRLPIRRKVYTARIGPGVRLGYRRGATSGTWSVLVADGRGGASLRRFALADDFEEADNVSVLSYGQALDQARSIARGAAGGGKMITVAQALDAYALDLRARGADVRNARRPLAHLPPHLLAKPVALLTVAELRSWRDGLIEKMTPSSVGRTARPLAAALALAARSDPRIGNRDAWRVGLERLPDSERSRNVIIGEAEVLSIISAANAIDSAFGLLVETTAVTGSRPSQITRLVTADLQDDRPDPRLMMPSSLKGSGRKRRERRPVPITVGLGERLRQTAAGRTDDAPLLVRPDGLPWGASDHRRLVKRAVVAAGLDPSNVTIYALRHSSIVRQLVANVPVRIVAANHDTSVTMIEKTYSRFIADHSDSLVRRTLLDIAQPAGDDVVALTAFKP